ncbi:MAG: hypothetical protein AAF986_03565 [Pseudomonadota bacterium]
MIDSILQSIRDYQSKHADLQACHHFTFDRRVNADGVKPVVAVIGMNPGEVKKDWRDFPTSTPLEESSEFDFRDGQKRPRNSTKWLNNIGRFLDGKPATTTEFFLWSTPDTDESFVERFGHAFEDSPHFDFCTKSNLALLEAHDIQLVVCPGLKSLEIANGRYGLRHVDTMRDERDGHRLVEHYEGQSRTWLFTKHWSGSRGFDAEQMNLIKEYILKQI